MKIDQLTAEQQAKLPEYRDKWLKIGLCTDPLNFEGAKKAACKAYRLVGLKEPTYFFRFKSPISAAIAAVIMEKAWGNNKEWKKFCELTEDQWDKKIDKIFKNMDEEFKKKVRDQISAQVFGCHDANWLGFYEFFWKECGIEEIAKLEGLIDLAHHCGWWSCFSEVCIFQDRPCEIHWKDKILHNENGMAVKYRDGFGLYCLNGVRMKKEHVMTPAEQLSPEIILSEPNAQVRRELVKKVGIERFIYKCGATVIDKLGTYELLELTWSDGRLHRYLKMQNPSVPEIWHVEGVGVDCKTVKEALHWRKPAAMKKIPVSENGEDWYQQGDVVLWPDGAESLKEFPSVLT